MYMVVQRTGLFRDVLTYALVVLLLASLPGCLVGPDYVPPEPQVPDSYKYAPVSKDSASSQELSTWWDHLGDPLLTDLIARALQSSPDVRGAIARIDEARSQLAWVAGAKLPTVEKAGTLQARRDSKNSGIGDTVITDIPNVTVSDVPYSFIGVVTHWEIDLFGRVRRAIESATADYQASIEDYRGVRVSLAAEIALTYVDIRTFQQRIEFARANIDAHRKTLELVELRRQAGQAPELDLTQAQANLASAESTLPPLQKELVQAMNRICVLVGVTPGTLDEDFKKPAPKLAPPETFPLRVPVELLRRRPDIRNAERRLAAQTARVGVAEADLYPRFVLLGHVGTESIKSSHALDTDSFTYSIGPSILWRLFDRNRVRSAIAVRNARVDQALVDYEQAVLLALEETEDAYVAYQRRDEQIQQLNEAVQAWKKSVMIAAERYKQGETAFLNLLDAERSLLQHADQLAESDGNLMKNLIYLYRALGGGWNWTETLGENKS